MQRVPGYITDLLTDRAIEFATRARRKPFMVYIGHKAIHPQIVQRDDGTVDVSTNQGFVPAARHRGKYAGKIYRRRSNFGLSVQDRAGKPVSDATIQSRAEMMLAVDEGVGRLCAALEEKALFENTLLVFMSDNGSFFGEHGLSVERRFPYEESIKSPLIMSHRAAIEPRRIDEFALSIDIAPTLLEAAQAEIPRSMQGRSLLPFALGRRALRSLQIHTLDTRRRGP